MRVIKRLALVEFWDKHKPAKTPLEIWFKVTRHASWRNFADVKATFGQTDQAKVKNGPSPVAIFDIGGNKYRLIARISYEKSKVYVLRIMTHKEYDRERWKEQL